MTSIELANGGSARLTFQRLAALEVKPAWLIVGILGLLSLQTLLLWRLLDFAPAWLYVLGIGTPLLVCAMLIRSMRRQAIAGPTLARLAICAGVALLLYLLGGEGRLFYANFDWQTRYAAIRDLTDNPWPFVYTARGVEEIFRAPVGMYLLPAVVGKLLGPAAADAALLLQNCFFLTALLGLASTLFQSDRTRLIALAVFLVFSGMDVIGLVARQALGKEVWFSYVQLGYHLEWWSGRVQYSSHITQAFWVPQHALSGWCGAVLFLLWKDGRIPVGAFLAAVPLLPLWSPLGALGILPFAAYAGVVALAKKGVRFSDVGAPALTAALSLPSLIYLGSAADSVGLRFFPVWPISYLLFQSVETLPYLGAAALLGWRARFGGITLLLVAALLLVLPFIQVGENIDFTMRVSIPALAILSVQVADVLTSSRTGNAFVTRAVRVMQVTALAVGSITGLMEVRRALIYSPPPLVTCSFPRAWSISAPGFGMSTYLAPIERLPALIRPERPFVLPPVDKAACWARPWAIRRGQDLTPAQARAADWHTIHHSPTAGLKKDE